jgi:hypothetical protein
LRDEFLDRLRGVTNGVNPLHDYAFWPFRAGCDGLLDPLRREPEYQVIYAKLNFPPSALPCQSRRCSHAAVHAMRPPSPISNPNQRG